MRLLQPGKSYLGLFPVFVVVFFGGFGLAHALFGNPTFGIISLPAFGILLLVCQIQSGVALDSWWQAKYERGRWEYRALIAWNAFIVFWFLILTYFFLS